MIYSSNWNTDLDFVQHRLYRFTQIFWHCVNTDFKQINFVKTDIYGLTKAFAGFRKKSDAFKLRFFITFGYLGFNPGLVLIFFNTNGYLGFNPCNDLQLQRSDLFLADRQERVLSHSVVTFRIYRFNDFFYSNHGTGEVIPMGLFLSFAYSAKNRWPLLGPKLSQKIWCF